MLEREHNWENCGVNPQRYRRKRADKKRKEDERMRNDGSIVTIFANDADFDCYYREDKRSS